MSMLCLEKESHEIGFKTKVARPNKWGNPFTASNAGMCDEVIARYRAKIIQQPPVMAALSELRGKHLAR
jgi:hypothetical protein